MSDGDLVRVQRLVAAFEESDGDLTPERLAELVPDATVEDLEGSANWHTAQGLILELSSAGHKQLVDLLEPFGYAAGIPLGEALAAVPEEWSERERLDRLIAALDDLDNILQNMELFSFSMSAEDARDRATIALSRPRL